MTILDAALAYAARGWPVFPCSSGGSTAKRPLTENGLHDASTDPDVIRAWWRRWPEAMIGLPTGARLGAFVVDLDPKDDATCEALLAALEDHVGVALGDPVTAVTQSGGWHLYFRWPAFGEGEEIRNRSKLVPKVSIDVRGEGGYVIAPPSVLEGERRYVWLGREDGQRGLTDAPPALVDCILRRGRWAPGRPEVPAGDRRREPGPGGTPGQVATRRYALAALDRIAGDARNAAKGGRGAAVYAAACAAGRFVGAGALSEREALAQLEDAAEANGLVADDGPERVRREIQRGLETGRADCGETAKRLAEIADEADARARRRQARAPRPSSGGSRPPPGGEGPPEDREPSEEGGEPLDPDILARCAKLEPNDTGNGHRLLAWFGRDMLHVRDVGWAVWDGTRWQVDGGEQAAHRFAQEAARRVRREVPLLALSDEDLDEAERKGQGEAEAKKKADARMASRARHAITSGNSARLAGMLAVAETHSQVTVAELDADPMAINLVNGTLRVEWGPDPECPDPEAVRLAPRFRLDPHRQEDRLSKLMRASYDPEACCPRWVAFVERFLPDPAVRWWVQRYHGYALTGLTDAQLLTFNFGLGANGKTTFTEAVRRLMGDYAAALPAEAVTGEQSRRSDQATPEFARLPGVRLVLVGELPRGQTLREETIKLVTGGEPMLVRHLNRGFFELRPTFKAVMTGNHKPGATGSDYAVWRRLRLVPWTERLEERERRPMGQVLREFDAEANGILNWLLDGLVGYLTEGLAAPPAITDATEEYRAEMDPVGEFAKECIRPSPGNEVPARAVFEAYQSWCEANSVRPFTETRFAREFSRTSIRKKSGRVRTYCDVILHDVPTREPTEQPRWA